MSAGASWNGYDYRAGKAVTWPRKEWRRLIHAAHRRLRVKTDQSLLLFDRIRGTDRIVMEVYDRDPPLQSSATQPSEGESA